MSVQISTGEITSSHRAVVRTDQGNLYAVFEDGTAVEVWFGGTTGATWTQKDAGNSPVCIANSPIGVAIDSDNRLHIVYYAGAAGAFDLDYVTFDTIDSTAGDDLFNTPEEAISCEDADNVLFGCAVAVDSNGVPHAVVTGSDANMGQDFNAVYYDNRIGGSWADRRLIEGGADELDCNFPGIEINSDNFPVITYTNSSDDTIDAVEGDANDPTAFATRELGTTTGAQNLSSICVDSNGDVWVAWRAVTTGIITISKQSANWTDAWTDFANSNAGLRPSIIADGTDIYVFYEEDASDDIVYDKYDGSWLGETPLETSVAYEFVKARFAFLNNASYDTYGIDYLFDDGTNIHWGNLDISPAEAYVPQIMMII